MVTLNINDLSVGDWVSLDMAHLEIKGDDIATAFVKKVQQPVRIKGISGDQDLIFAEVETEDNFGTIYLKMEHIRPIPITTEILEANGFEEHCGGIFRYKWMWQGESSGITLDSFDEELWFVDLFFKEGKDIMCNIPTFSVHQLQHILRLAGVDKEINL